MLRALRDNLFNFWGGGDVFPGTQKMVFIWHKNHIILFVDKKIPNILFEKWKENAQYTYFVGKYLFALTTKQDN
jgi:hypothetical protein